MYPSLQCWLSVDWVSFIYFRNLGLSSVCSHYTILSFTAPYTVAFSVDWVSFFFSQCWFIECLFTRVTSGVLLQTLTCSSTSLVKWVTRASGHWRNPKPAGTSSRGNRLENVSCRSLPVVLHLQHYVLTSILGKFSKQGPLFSQSSIRLIQV